MVYLARERGDMVDPFFVAVDVAILNQPNVLVASGVPYKKGVQVYPLAEAIETLDVDVLFIPMDRSDHEIYQRLLTARKYEILIPGCAI